MKLRVVTERTEACVNTYNGPIVLPDGTLMGCSCVAAMDAIENLGIGNILHSSLEEIWKRSGGVPGFEICVRALGQRS